MNVPWGVVAGSEDSDPYLRVLPVRKLLTTIYETVSVSNSMQEFQLISTGKTLLNLMDQIRDPKPKIQNDDKHSDIISVELEKLWTIFSTILNRVLSNENYRTETCNKDVDDFLDFIWGKHKIGTTNPTAEIRVMSKLLLLSPNRLEELLCSSLSSSEPGIIVPYCEKNSDIFMAIMLRLSHKYKNPGTLKSCDEEVMVILENRDIVNYTERLIFNLLTIHSRYDYYNLYPSIFHPVLAFDKSISDCKNSASLLENVQVLEEFFVLLDNFVNHCINILGLEYVFLNFFVKIHNNLNTVLTKAKCDDTVRFKMYPFLWMFVRNFKN